MERYFTLYYTHRSSLYCLNLCACFWKPRSHKYIRFHSFQQEHNPKSTFTDPINDSERGAVLKSFWSLRFHANKRLDEWTKTHKQTGVQISSVFDPVVTDANQQHGRVILNNYWWERGHSKRPHSDGVVSEGGMHRRANEQEGQHSAVQKQNWQHHRRVVESKKKKQKWCRALVGPLRGLSCTVFGGLKVQTVFFRSWISKSSKFWSCV